MTKNEKNEPWLAFPPSVLARVLCRHCMACGRRDSRRHRPLQCPSVKRFIAQLRDRAAEF